MKLNEIKKKLKIKSKVQKVTIKINKKKLWKKKRKETNI